MSDQSNQQPGLIGAHAQYVKGAAVGTVGAVTGSQEWKDSAEQTKAQAVEAMKTASENRDPSTQGYGKVEEIAGKATGCEGMVKEGEESQKQ